MVVLVVLPPIMCGPILSVLKNLLKPLKNWTITRLRSTKQADPASPLVIKSLTNSNSFSGVHVPFYDDKK